MRRDAESSLSPLLMTEDEGFLIDVESLILSGELLLLVDGMERRKRCGVWCNL